MSLKKKKKRNLSVSAVTALRRILQFAFLNALDLLPSHVSPLKATSEFGVILQVLYLKGVKLQRHFLSFKADSILMNGCISKLRRKHAQYNLMNFSHFKIMGCILEPLFQRF